VAFILSLVVLQVVQVSTHLSALCSTTQSPVPNMVRFFFGTYHGPGGNPPGTIKITKLNSDGSDSSFSVSSSFSVYKCANPPPDPAKGQTKDYHAHLIRSFNDPKIVQASSSVSCYGVLEKGLYKGKFPILRASGVAPGNPIEPKQKWGAGCSRGGMVARCWSVINVPGATFGDWKFEVSGTTMVYDPIGYPKSVCSTSKRQPVVIRNLAVSDGLPGCKGTPAKASKAVDVSMCNGGMSGVACPAVCKKKGYLLTGSILCKNGKWRYQGGKCDPPSAKCPHNTIGLNTVQGCKCKFGWFGKIIPIIPKPHWKGGCTAITQACIFPSELKGNQVTGTCIVPKTMGAGEKDFEFIPKLNNPQKWEATTVGSSGCKIKSRNGEARCCPDPKKGCAKTYSCSCKGVLYKLVTWAIASNTCEGSAKAFDDEKFAIIQADMMSAVMKCGLLKQGSKPFKLMKKKAKPKPKVSYKLDIKSSDCHITAELSVAFCKTGKQHALVVPQAKGKLSSRTFGCGCKNPQGIIFDSKVVWMKNTLEKTQRRCAQRHTTLSLAIFGMLSGQRLPLQLLTLMSPKEATAIFAWLKYNIWIPGQAINQVCANPSKLSAIMKQLQKHANHKAKVGKNPLLWEQELAAVGAGKLGSYQEDTLERAEKKEARKYAEFKAALTQKAAYNKQSVGKLCARGKAMMKMFSKKMDYHYIPGHSEANKMKAMIKRLLRIGNNCGSLKKYTKNFLAKFAKRKQSDHSPLPPYPKLIPVSAPLKALAGPPPPATPPFSKAKASKKAKKISIAPKFSKLANPTKLRKKRKPKKNTTKAVAAKLVSALKTAKKVAKAAPPGPPCATKASTP